MCIYIYVYIPSNFNDHLFMDVVVNHHFPMKRPFLSMSHLRPHRTPLARRIAEAMIHINMIPTKTCCYLCHFSLASLVLKSPNTKEMRHKNL